MIKYLILFIHLIGLSFYQLFFGEVTVNQKLPNKVQAGQEITVEIIIKKEGVGGFAKVQQTLPQGFIAEVGDSKGATFSYKDNVVKFIWMALPAENEFTITYKLKTTQETEGDFQLGGKFSYIDENERKNVEISSTQITVSKEDLVTESVETEVEAPIEEEVIEEENSVASETENLPIEETSTDKKVTIKINRKVENKEGNYLVTLTFDQENLEGFAKVVDVVPAGFTAEAIDTKGGVFSFNDGEAKVLWMASPQEKDFEVTYLLKGNVSGEVELNGSFSYLENDITQKYIINSTSFTATGIVEEEALTVEEEVVEEEPVINEVEEVTEEVVEETPSNQEDLVNKVTSTPKPETGVSYKVQVGAGHASVSSNYFAKRFNLNDAISIESHQGWIKYVTGTYSVYKEARDKRNEVRNKVKTAFVTAYNQGKRITVQEALMISNQQWYK